MASFSRLPSLSVQLSLFSLLLPSSSSASLHPRNADFRPQGLKSGWRGANYYGKENKTRMEGGKRDRESGGGERDRRRGEEQRCCSLTEEKTKKKQRDKHTEKWGVHFPCFICPLRAGKHLGHMPACAGCKVWKYLGFWSTWLEYLCRIKGWTSGISPNHWATTHQNTKTTWLKLWNDQSLGFPCLTRSQHSNRVLTKTKTAPRPFKGSGLLECLFVVGTWSDLDLIQL